MLAPIHGDLPLSEVDTVAEPKRRLHLRQRIPDQGDDGKEDRAAAGAQPAGKVYRIGSLVEVLPTVPRAKGHFTTE